MKAASSSKIKLLLATSALISVGTIHAASAQTVPNNARPDVVQRQYRIEETRPEVGGAPVISSSDADSTGIEGDMTFTLQSINFVNLNVYTEEELSYIYEDKIGETITLSELNAIINQITAHYRNNGYILSRAVLPPQRIEDGTVTIRIVEGFINNVTLEGDVGSENSPIHEYARKIRESKPLNAEKLERYLLLMEDLPGVEARAVLTPADVSGASDVVVTITRKPVEASASLDNRGSRFLGPIQAGVTLAGNNILGLDEQTQVRVINSILETDELKFGEIRHEEQLGSEGLKLVVSGSYVKTEPGSRIENQNVEGTSTTFTVGLTYPIIRSRQANWFVDGDVTSKHTDVDILNTNFYEDKLRILNLGTSYDFVDSFAAVNRMEAEFSQGFNWVTGRDNAQSRSRINGETNFSKLFAQVSRLQPVSGPWSVYGVASGQYSADPLLASEEFVIGGPVFGSAYDSAELTGDQGAAARLELQYNESAGWEYLSEYQLYGFYDIGKVWNRNIIAASEKQKASLASAGIGARFNISDSLSGSLEAAMPLTKNVSAFGDDGDAPRGFFSILYRY